MQSNRFFRRLTLASLLLLFLQSLEAQGMAVTEIALGVYLRPGLHEEFSEQNRGHLANIGFIVGTEGVAVIDTGSSYQEGLALRTKIREITDLPIEYVILTHMHPDHSLGAAAFSQDKPIYVGHEQLGDALARRETVYLNSMRQLLGSIAEGTRVVFPQKSVPVGGTLELELGGRTLHLQAYPTAHTNNDLSVYDDTTGTLWLSDLLFVERIPVVDGSLLGWLKVIDFLSNKCQSSVSGEKTELTSSDAKQAAGCRQVNRVVPGHGPVVVEWREALADQRHYLEHIAAGIRKIIKKGGTITQAVESVGWDERDNWRLFNEFHGRNITAVFAELEWE